MYKVYYGTTGHLLSTPPGSYCWIDRTLMYSTASNDPKELILDAVLHREANSAGYFEATVPKDNVCWANLALMSGMIEVERDDEIIWQGRIVEIEKDFDLSKHIYCEGELAYLNDFYVFIDWSKIKTTDSNGKTVYDWATFFSTYCCTYDFLLGDKVGRTIISRTSYISDEAKQYISDKLLEIQPPLNNDSTYMTAYDALVNNFINGMMAPFKDKIFLSISRTKEYNEINQRYAYKRYLVFSILYTPEVENESSEETVLCGDLPITVQNVEFGKNMLDYKEVRSVESLINTVYAFGYETTGWWIFSSTNAIYGVARDEADSDIHGAYTYYFSVDGTSSTVESLTLQANKKLAEFKSNRYPIEYQINAVDLLDAGEDTDHLDFMKRSRIISGPHEIDHVMLCTSLTEPLDDPTAKEFIFGTKQSTLSQMQATNNTVLSRAYNMSFTAKDYITKS